MGKIVGERPQELKRNRSYCAFFGLTFRLRVVVFFVAARFVVIFFSPTATCFVAVFARGFLVDFRRVVAVFLAATGFFDAVAALGAVVGCFTVPSTGFDESILFRTTSSIRLR